jgi:hypothetical protein
LSVEDILPYFLGDLSRGQMSGIHLDPNKSVSGSFGLDAMELDEPL